jgi:hypothetical protein
MASAFRHVVIVGKYQARGIRPVLEEIAHFLVGRGLEVSFDRDTAEATGVTDFDALSHDEMATRCDLAVVVGGDGTMLGIARDLARRGVPLVGINQGRLGFITDVAIGQYREALAPIVEGHYEQESRSMLEGDVWRDGLKIFEGLSLNDVVVSRGATASMVELRVDVDDDFVANLRLSLGVEVRPGNEYAAAKGLPGLWQTLEKLPRHQWPTFTRGDCGYGSETVMLEHEERELPYLFKLRHTAKVKDLVIRMMRQGADWQDCGDGWQALETTLRLSGWSKERRVILVRETPSAAPIRPLGKVGERGPRPRARQDAPLPAAHGDQTPPQISSENVSPALIDWTKSVISRITFSTSPKSAISTMECM